MFKLIDYTENQLLILKKSNFYRIKQIRISEQNKNIFSKNEIIKFNKKKKKKHFL